MATLQVKGLDERLYRALGARAAMDNRSISQEVVMMIREFLAAPSRNPRAATQAVLELAGTWKDDRTARQIVSDLRRSRRSGRRFGKDADVLD
jgi:plasmid stability protein